MSNATHNTSGIPTTRREPRELMTMDPQLTDIQPGGGIVIHLEQAWGRIRRAWLKTFCSGYVKRMEVCRKGDFNPCPHEVLDPRDLKFHRNQAGWYRDAADDPFASRDRLPFARVGLAELLLMAGGFFAATAALGWWAMRSDAATRVVAAVLAAAAAVCGILIVWFFRDPPRSVPTAAGLVVSPADAKVVEIEELAHDDFIGGPAIKIGIFLSIFNVHVNRAPLAGRVVGLTYTPGKYLNALRPESARENERLTVLMESPEPPEPPYRGFVVRQITGAIARRIVCWLKPGDTLQRGEQFGMIKLGSRTELLLPAEASLQIRTSVGTHVKAGISILAKYKPSGSQDPVS